MKGKDGRKKHKNTLYNRKNSEIKIQQLGQIQYQCKGEMRINEQIKLRSRLLCNSLYNRTYSRPSAIIVPKLMPS